MSERGFHAAVDGVVARLMYRAAMHWLGVWRGAGFEPRVEGDKFYMPAKWREDFPDGPYLVDILRRELLALLTQGREAFAADPRLKIRCEVQYRDYAGELAGVRGRELRAAEALARNPRDDAERDHLNREIGRLKAELAAALKRVAEANAQLRKGVAAKAG